MICLKIFLLIYQIAACFVSTVELTQIMVDKVMKQFIHSLLLAFLIQSVYAEDLKDNNEETLSAVNDETRNILKANAEFLLRGTLPLKPYETFEKKNVTVKGASRSASNKSSNDYQTSWGSYDKTNLQSKKLVVTVSSVSPRIASGLEFFWVLTDIRTKEIIYSPEKAVLLPEGVGEAEFSETTENKDLNLAYIGYRKKSGEKITGWMVRVVSLLDGRVVGADASSEQLKKIALSGSVIPVESE